MSRLARVLRRWIHTPSTPRERAAALCDLMALPDPPCLVGLNGAPRGYVYTCGRAEHRDAILRDLLMAAAMRRCEEHGRPVSEIVSKRTYALKLVRRA